MRLTRTSSMMISALIITIILAGCGVVATGVPSATNHARTAVPPEATYVILQSDTGDFIGGGQAFTYTLADTHINVSAMRGHLSVTIVGDERWSGDFQVPDSLKQLQPGYYGDLKRYPFHNPVKGGLNWSGEGRGSNKLTGWFAVDSVTYVKGVLAAIDLRFEQHSEGASPALRGQIHWQGMRRGSETTPLLR